jgi:SAM-dependent MidA family methyltransferase
MALRDRLIAQIARYGPITVADYADICLNDPVEGYYATHPNLGEAGDFITAPMITQMFGEGLGLWAAEVWSRLGRPKRVRLVEIGPGLGVMMVDILRAARILPAFLDSIEVWLVETSRPLRARQAETLRGLASPRWVSTLDEAPEDAPMIVLANEVLDCLPIRQAILGRAGWRERRVGLDTFGALAFVTGEAITPPGLGDAALRDARPGAVAEWSPPLAVLGRAVAAKITRCGGAGLFIDYGHAAPALGDTLQAVRHHRKEHPLSHPGAADLTAHVDFQTFLAAGQCAGAWTGPIRTQGEFLIDLGLPARAEILARTRPDQADVIGRQLERLIGPDQMGVLFKCAALASPGLVPPVFEAGA